jgi:hypothetical protein
MEAIIGAGGVVVGLLLGIIIRTITMRTLAAKWRTQLRDAWREVDQLKRERKSELAKARATVGSAETELTCAQEQVAALERKIRQRDTELGALRDEITIREAPSEEANTTARFQAERRAKLAEEQAAAAARRAEELEAKLAALEADGQALQTEVKTRTGEIKRLRSDVISLREANRAELSLEDSVGLFSDAAGNLDGILRVLIEYESQDAAVLADSGGIVICSAGTSDMSEGMATASQLVAALGAQLKDMIPFEAIMAFNLRDAGNSVITGESFEAAGEHVILATFGSRAPAAQTLTGAKSSLIAALE